jgi:hypothetical protein
MVMKVRTAVTSGLGADSRRCQRDAILLSDSDVAEEVVKAAACPDGKSYSFYETYIQIHRFQI